MKDRNHTEEVELIRASNCYSLDGRITDEERLSAFFRTPRKTILASLFHPKGQTGIPYVRVGNRHVCTVQALEAYLTEHAKPQATSRQPAKPRRKNRCRDT